MQPAAASYRERQVLESRFHADVRVYCDAVQKLESCPAKDFKLIYEAAERPTLAVEKARSS
jgi:hypothetical protein